MDNKGKIYVAGHRGLAGSAIMRLLRDKGYSNIVARTHAELDLRDQAAVRAFFDLERPQYVFFAAAKVGGILANSTLKAEFIADNLSIALNVIDSAWRSGAKKLLNLGSSCIYPRLAQQPIREEYLLTGELEPTNEPYAIAKIAALKLCRYYNEQYGTNFITAMPTNLYGPHDHFGLNSSHVLPGLIRKFHLAKLLCEGNADAVQSDFERFGDAPPAGASVTDHCASFGLSAGKVALWGSGTPLREFLFADDLARASVHLMEWFDYREVGELVNVGTGSDLPIRDLAGLIRNIVGFDGEVEFDRTKPDGMRRKQLDVSKIRGMGWEPSVGLEEGIRKTYDWYCGAACP